MNIDEKYNELQNILREMGEVVVAFSGGVDSTFLLKAAVDELGDRVLAVIAQSSTYPERELKEAVGLAEMMNAEVRVIQTEEENNPDYYNNPVNRCFFCKQELFTKILEVADQEGYKFVAEGTNLDDLGEYRPGLKALKDLSVRSPLKEAGFTKSEIRELSKKAGLPTHDKQSYACLASRLPYGSRITSDKLNMVDEAEEFLLGLGLKTVRARHYDKTVRLEFALSDFPLILDDSNREKIIKKLKDIGYTYITLDLEGFRSGSMNAVLK
ncbi:MAG: ATP-dependent sacrificial sulfur transferase LarE [bacterium]|nr:ATP-dependent sacrificial sulfur transferase LarE [bacterium]